MSPQKHAVSTIIGFNVVCDQIISRTDFVVHSKSSHCKTRLRVHVICRYEDTNLITTPRHP